MFDCHGQGGNQFFAFAKNRMIATQNPEQCIGVSEKLDAVVTVKCMSEESQLWKYNKAVRIAMKGADQKISEDLIFYSRKSG